MISAHHPIATETAQEVLTAWSWEPTVLASLGLVGGLYTVGLLRSRGRRARLFPWWRPACFYTGLLLLLLALVSPIDALSYHLFFMHMIQHSLITMWAAPLILLGGPVIPVLRGLPRLVRRRIVVPLARNAPLRQLLSTLTMARVGFILYFGGIWVWHVPVFYTLALENELVHVGEHSFFLGTALLFWWAVIDPVPFRPHLGYPTRLIYLFGAATPNAALGAFLTYSPGPWYDFYLQETQLWGFTPMQDQSLGGIIMWLPSWMMFLLAISVVFFIMMGQEERSLRARASLREGARVEQRR